MADLAPFNFIAPPTGRGGSLRPWRPACKVGGNGKDCSELKWWDMQRGPGGKSNPLKYKQILQNSHYWLSQAHSFLPGTVHELTAHPLVGRISRLVIHCCSFLFHQATSSASSQGPSAALCKVFHFALVSTSFMSSSMNEKGGSISEEDAVEQQRVLRSQKHPLVFVACCNSSG